MRDATRTLMDERDWWRRVAEGTHYALTDAAHELSDEAVPKGLQGKEALYAIREQRDD